MKNVAFLVPNLANGGAQRVASRLSNIISDFANPIAFVYQRVISYSFAGQVVSLDIPYHYEGNQSIPAKLKRRALAVRKVCGTKRKYNISTTISFLTEQNIVNALSICGDRTILTMHSVLSITRKDKNKLSDYLDNLIIYLSFKLSDETVTVSQFMRDDLVDTYGVDESKLTVIPNSVDVEVLEKQAGEKLHTDYLSLFNSPVVVNVGRITRQKGHLFLIRAFEKVSRKVEDASLVILGQGRLEKSLVRLIHKLGLEEKVHLLGFHDNPFKFMRRADVFVLSSRWGGVRFGGLISRDACSSNRLPIWSTRNPGSEHIVPVSSQ
ncbi:MAG: glycosyltransferase [Candidatus Aenigmatarchaeota archaeon]